MAERKFYIGSHGPFFYDDADPIDDPDGDFSGLDRNAVVTNGQMRVETAPSVDEHVLRLIDIGGIELAAVAVADIDNPTALNSLSGSTSSLLLAYEAVAGENFWTLYGWDSAVAAGADSPWVVAGSSGYWIAIAGRYVQHMKIDGGLTLRSDNDKLLFGAGSDVELFFNGTDFWIDSTGDQIKIGDAGGGSNYVEVADNGSISFAGTARISWIKITADSVTLSAGSSSELVADLQTAHDGNVYHITEAVATPGITLIIDFVNVTAFNWVGVLATYEGLTTHALEIELYNWSTTVWDHFQSIQTGESNSGTIFGNQDFLVPDDSNYIGTGANVGDVRVRINHPMAGNASHDLYIDAVALYQ